MDLSLFTNDRGTKVEKIPELYIAEFKADKSHLMYLNYLSFFTLSYQKLCHSEQEEMYIQNPAALTIALMTERTVLLPVTWRRYLQDNVTTKCYAKPENNYVLVLLIGGEVRASNTFLALEQICMI